MADFSTIPAADIGRELIEEHVLLSRLAEMAKQNYHLPVCCLGLMRHTGKRPNESITEPDVFFSLESKCEHVDSNGSYRFGIFPRDTEDATPDVGIIPVHLGKSFCGTVGVRRSNGFCHAINGGMPKFLEQFKAHYLRYYLYHQSMLWMDADNPVIIMGMDPELLDAQLMIGKYADSFLPVLIEGETGTGKELWARALHLWSARYSQPFLPVNCSHLTDDQMAISSLFGHRRGSYTGAIGDRKGYFEKAAGGTLFLDEIDSLSPRVQSMLLRAIETGEVHKLGADYPEVINVRLIGATNANLEKHAVRGQMRRDFLYRMRGHTITLPPLRERIPADSMTLARFFLRQLNRQLKADKYFSPEIHEQVTSSPWPGNVRELRNAVMTAFFNSENAECIRPKHFPTPLKGMASFPGITGESGIEENLFAAMIEENRDFWEVVYTPFMNRDLNREQVKGVIRLGFREVDDYKELMEMFNIPGIQYRKFMDFLRNHDLRV